MLDDDDEDDDKENGILLLEMNFLDLIISVKVASQNTCKTKG